MFDFLLQRSTVVVLALLGVGLSTAVTMLSARGLVSQPGLALLNKAAYGCMGLSMLLFIAVGLS